MLPKLTSSGGTFKGLNGIDHRGIVASQLCVQRIFRRSNSCPQISADSVVAADHLLGLNQFSG